jgi:hypothetical protein
MKRLNGWQRIGLIASVIWILGGTIWTMQNRQSQAQAFGNAIWNSCMNSLDLDPAAKADYEVWEHGNALCARKGTEASSNAGQFVFFQTTDLAFPLIALGVASCLLVYFVVGLVRWVRAGFKQA